MNISINSKSIAVQGVRALRPGITVEQATQKTKKNGLDEVYFKSNGQYFVAYGDSLELGDLRKNAIPAVMFNGVQADIITYDDEVNSMLEGAGRGALDELNNGIDFVRKSIGSMITRVGPTAMGAAAVGAAGLGLYKLWQESQKIGAIGASLAASGAAAGGTMSIAASAGGGASAIIGGIKIAAISGLAGIGVLAAYGALRGALEAKAAPKDYASIASVTEDGASPTNQGAALSWQQLNANAPANHNDMNTPVNTNPYNSPVSTPIIPGDAISNPIFQSPSQGVGNSPFDMYGSNTAAPARAVGVLMAPATMAPSQLQAAGQR